MNKTDLRKRMRSLREGQSAEDAARGAAAISRRVLELPTVQFARRMFVYIAAPGEVETRPLIASLLAQGKTLAAPRIDTAGCMHARCFRRLDELRPGRWDIPAPAVDAPLMDEPDVCLTPGLAFTADGRRLGRAGGYYDRYLAAHAGVVAVGLAFDWQVVEDLPTDDYDQRMRFVVTPGRVYDCGV